MKETITFLKTYGIMKNCRGRYAITLDISPDKTEYRTIDDLNYAKPDFALVKAEGFVKRLHQDFVNFQGFPVHFEFQNMGEIQPLPASARSSY